MSKQTDDFWKDFEEVEIKERTKEFDGSFVKGQFGDNKAVFILRQLTLDEYTNANDALQKSESEKRFFDVYSKMSKDELAEYLAKAFGNGTEGKESELGAKIKFFLRRGIKSPANPQKTQINKLCKFFPMQAFNMFLQISQLTDEGGLIAEKKQNSSGKAK